MSEPKNVKKFALQISVVIHMASIYYLCTLVPHLCVRQLLIGCSKRLRELLKEVWLLEGGVVQPEAEPVEEEGPSNEPVAIETDVINRSVTQLS